jgi:hypothetical protein
MTISLFYHTPSSPGKKSPTGFYRAVQGAYPIGHRDAWRFNGKGEKEEFIDPSAKAVYAGQNFILKHDLFRVIFFVS